jgi:hypothetical protein
MYASQAAKAQKPQTPQLAAGWQWWQLADALARMNQDEVVAASQRYLFLGNRLNAPW